MNFSTKNKGLFPAIDTNIDYATGESSSDEVVAELDASKQEEINNNKNDGGSSGGESTYILNTNTRKFHNPNCSSVDQMKDSNKQEYTGNRNDLISQGYAPCKRCNP